MTIENYFKFLIRENNFSTESMAKLFGMTIGSFKNKIARKTTNLSDVIVFAESCGKKLAIVDDDGKISYTFDAENTLSLDDYERLCDFIKENGISKIAPEESVDKSLTRFELIQLIDKAIQEKYRK